MADNEEIVDDGLHSLSAASIDFEALQTFIDVVTPDHRGLHSECMLIVGSALDAEDILQQTLYYAYNNLVKFDGTASISEWFAGIARTNCQRWLQQRNALPNTIEHDPSVLRLYAERSNKSDWNGVRALFADDIRLDVANSYSGKFRDVYFDEYASTRGSWSLQTGTLDGENILVRWEAAERWETNSFIRIETIGDRISRIADYSRLWWLLYNAPDFSSNLP